MFQQVARPGTRRIRRRDRAAKHDIRLAVESPTTYSQSGAPLARTVREAGGVEATGDEQRALEHGKPAIDERGDALRETLLARMKQYGSKWESV